MATPEAVPAILRFEDGFVNMRGMLKRFEEWVINEAISAYVDQLCTTTGHSRNGYGESMLTICVGTLTLRISKIRV